MKSVQRAATPKPALLGGEPVFARALSWPDIWPPVDDVTERRLRDVYRSRRWTAWDETESDFAQAFAAYHGTRHGIFMVNGTVTLQCALGACGIGPGDEVIVPPLTWYATEMGPHYVGAKLVFVDIEPETLCIDPVKIEAAITERTKAIVPVHAFSAMADMDRIMAIARKHGVRVIEDCAHVHGGAWGPDGIGSIGDVGSFRFQHSKTMAAGEGGICITNDAELADRIYRMKHIGYGPGQMPGKASSGPPPGLLCHNFRATAFPALILHEQLKTLEERLETYRNAARYLEERLAQSTRIRFQQPGQRTRKRSYWQWLMIFDDPAYDDIPISLIQQALAAEGLPVTPTWDPVYRFILFNLEPHAYHIPQPCEVTERIAKRALCLLHAYLSLEMSQIERAADAIEKVVQNFDALRAHAGKG